MLSSNALRNLTMSTKITQSEILNAVSHLQQSAKKLRNNPDSETLRELVRSNKLYLESMIQSFTNQVTEGLEI